MERKKNNNPILAKFAPSLGEHSIRSKTPKKENKPEYLCALQSPQSELNKADFSVTAACLAFSTPCTLSFFFKCIENEASRRFLSPYLVVNCHSFSETFCTGSFVFEVIESLSLFHVHKLLVMKDDKINLCFLGKLNFSLKQSWEQEAY